MWQAFNSNMLDNLHVYPQELCKNNLSHDTADIGDATGSSANFYLLGSSSGRQVLSEHLDLLLTV